MPKKSKLKRSNEVSQSRDEYILSDLVQQRLVLKRSIQRVKTNLEERVCEIVELECRQEMLDSYCEKILNCQSEMEILDPVDQGREEIEILIIETKTLLKSKINALKFTNAPKCDQGANTNNISRLPKMALPKFNGQYSEFQSFMSLFESLVHNNPSISNIEKFNHLTSCLSGEALGTVKVFHQTEENYPKALASLKKVYDNKCLIYFDTISKLIDLQPINKPSSHSLRTLIDTVSAIFDSLLSLGDEKNVANGIIIALAMAKVDAETRSKWEEQLDYTKLPMWVECEAALNKRFQYLSKEESFSTMSNSHSPKANKVNHKNNNKSRSSLLVSDSKQPKCLFCNTIGHQIFSCQVFKEKPVEERFVFAKSNSLCINCLQQGHSVSKCKSSRCKVCNRSHNTLLHRYTIEQQPATPQTMHAHTVSQTMSESKQNLIQ